MGKRRYEEVKLLWCVVITLGLRNPDMMKYVILQGKVAMSHSSPSSSAHHQRKKITKDLLPVGGFKGSCGSGLTVRDSYLSQTLMYVINTLFLEGCSQTIDKLPTFHWSR